MKNSKRSKIFLFVFLLSGIMLAVYRVAPYFSSMIPLGYDPGVYRGIYLAYIKLFPFFHFGHVPYWIMHEPLRGILTVLVSKLGISIDTWLTFGLGFFSLLGGFFVYFITKKYTLRHNENLKFSEGFHDVEGIPTASNASISNEVKTLKNSKAVRCSKQAAIFAMIIFRVSIIQYYAFELCYFKQVLGVDLILLLIYLRNKKIFRRSIPALIALVLLHRTTTLYLGATSLLRILFQYFQTKRIPRTFIWVWIISGTAGLALYGPMFPRLIVQFFHPLVSTVGGAGEQGNFFSLQSFRRFVMFLIAPTLYAVYLKIKNKEYDLVFSGFIIGIVRTSLGLLNAKRMEIHLDIFLILMTGYTIFHLFQRSSRWKSGLIYLFIFLQMVYYFGYVSENRTPLITTGELTSITTLKTILPTNALVVVTDSAISPRVVGYSELDVIAPGLSDINKRTHTQRNQWRPANGKVKCDMFQVYKKLDRPIYMRESKLFRIEDISGGTCFKLIREDEFHKVYQILLP